MSAALYHGALDLSATACHPCTAKITTGDSDHPQTESATTYAVLYKTLYMLGEIVGQPTASIRMHRTPSKEE